MTLVPQSRALGPVSLTDFPSPNGLLTGEAEQLKKKRDRDAIRSAKEATDWIAFGTNATAISACAIAAAVGTEGLGEPVCLAAESVVIKGSIFLLALTSWGFFFDELILDYQPIYLQSLKTDPSSLQFFTSEHKPFRVLGTFSNLSAGSARDAILEQFITESIERVIGIGLTKKLPRALIGKAASLLGSKWADKQFPD